MSKERLVLLFDIEWFESVHLHKDVGMIPLYFHKLYNFDSTIVFYDNERNRTLNNVENEIKLKRIRKNVLNKVKGLRKFISPMMIYLIKNARNIDMLMLFHLKKENYLYRFLYKLLNPKGKIYLKLDINLKSIESLEILNEEEQKSLNIFKYKNGIISYLRTLKRKFDFKKMKYELSKFDAISVETKYAFENVRKLLQNNVNHNLVLVPNGFPDEIENAKYVKEFKDKDNIIFTVGRIGTIEKNNEMLLKAAEKLEFKDWKIYLIGPIDNKFNEYIQGFYEKNPTLKNKVIFTGNITEKSTLYEWYAKSKVFCLTSISEGFPLVFPEAIYYGDYVVSTKVGADFDITNGGALGERIDIDDVETLAKVLQEIIDNKIDVERKYHEIIKHSRENFVWDKVLEKLYCQLYK